MAFQTGTQVRPELGRYDVSGFARAGMITGQALADLGAQIGGAITKYQVNKQNAEDKKLRYEAILPYTTSLFGAEEGEKMAKSFSNDPKTAATIMEYAGIQRERDIVNKAAGVSMEAGTGKINKQDFASAYMELGGRNLPGTLNFIDELSGPGEIKISKEGVITQNGEFMGQISKQAAERVPTSVLESEYKRKKLAEAQNLYSQGRIREAQNITTSIGQINEITGEPIPVSELFPEITPNPDPDPDPTPEPEPTPTPAPGSPLSEKELERLNQLRSKRAGL